jgi:DNA-binding beta-propeller fold protein YncE
MKPSWSTASSTGGFLIRGEGAPPCDQTVTNPSQPGWNRVSVVLLKESTAQFGKISAGFYPNLLTVDPSTGNVYVPIVFKNVVTQFHL